MAEQPVLTDSTFGGRSILLIISGGIAAYKSLDLIRRLRERGAQVSVVMTKAAQEFVTPLSVSAIAGEPAHTDLFDIHEEHDIGHIRLARAADLVIIAPATADLMAKMASGLAGDLAGAVLLANGAPILAAPAMNPHMWAHKATQRNVAQLRADGVQFIGPNSGEMAECNEAGVGRMAEPMEIVAAAASLLARSGPLAGKHVLVTSGPTHEPLDPVRYIANRSSGKQGHAIAAAAARAGARVTLVSGPVSVADPPGVDVVRVESARDMLAAVEAALPADIGIFAAAVADWRPANEGTQKVKKTGKALPDLTLTENPDILATVSQLKKGRPDLVIGFAAETEKVIAHAQAKLKRKGCDWIVANDVSAGGTSEGGVMGGDLNKVIIIERDGEDRWPEMDKAGVAERLVARIADHMEAK